MMLAVRSAPDWPSGAKMASLFPSLTLAAVVHNAVHEVALRFEALPPHMEVVGSIAEPWLISFQCVCVGCVDTQVSSQYKVLHVTHIDYCGFF